MQQRFPQMHAWPVQERADLDRMGMQQYRRRLRRLRGFSARSLVILQLEH